MKPTRLLHDYKISAELRGDLEHASALDIAYDSKRGFERLQLAIGSLGVASQSSASASAPPPALAEPTSLLGSLGLKVGVAIAGAALLGAGSTFLLNRPLSRQETPRTLTVPAARSVPTPEIPQLEVSVQPKSVQPSSRVRLASDRDAALRRETAHLGRIKARLESQPLEAYRLAQAGHEEFKSGMLRQEREGLAVLALWNMNRNILAVRHTQAFLTRYPDSPLRGQLEQRLRMDALRQKAP